MNILPVRFKFNPTQNFIHATKEAQKRVTVAISHAKLPFDVILAGLKAVRNLTYSPIFQASFDYREAAKKTFLDHEMYSPPENLSLNSNGYDVSLGVLETAGEGCTAHIGVQSALYSQQDAEVILRTYQHLLETFAERPASRVDRPLLFSKTDVARGIVLGLGKISISLVRRNT
jgi:hybrid polyketide synthase/nonribosomal peptide synthetase ACE1